MVKSFSKQRGLERSNTLLMFEDLFESCGHDIASLLKYALVNSELVKRHKYQIIDNLRRTLREKINKSEKTMQGLVEGITTLYETYSDAEKYKAVALVVPTFGPFELVQRGFDISVELWEQACASVSAQNHQSIQGENTTSSETQTPILANSTINDSYLTECSQHLNHQFNRHLPSLLTSTSSPPLSHLVNKHPICQKHISSMGEMTIPTSIHLLPPNPVVHPHHHHQYHHLENVLPSSEQNSNMLVYKCKSDDGSLLHHLHSNQATNYETYPPSLSPSSSSPHQQLLQTSSKSTTENVNAANTITNATTSDDIDQHDLSMESHFHHHYRISETENLTQEHIRQVQQLLQQQQLEQQHSSSYHHHASHLNNYSEDHESIGCDNNGNLSIGHYDNNHAISMNDTMSHHSGVLNYGHHQHSSPIQDTPHVTTTHTNSHHLSQDFRPIPQHDDATHPGHMFPPPQSPHRLFRLSQMLTAGDQTQSVQDHLIAQDTHQMAPLPLNNTSDGYQPNIAEKSTHTLESHQDDHNHIKSNKAHPEAISINQGTKEPAKKRAKNASTYLHLTKHSDLSAEQTSQKFDPLLSILVQQPSSILSMDSLTKANAKNTSTVTTRRKRKIISNVDSSKVSHGKSTC